MRATKAGKQTACWKKEQTREWREKYENESFSLLPAFSSRAASHGVASFFSRRAAEFSTRLRDSSGKRAFRQVSLLVRADRVGRRFSRALSSVLRSFKVVISFPSGQVFKVFSEEIFAGFFRENC